MRHCRAGHGFAGRRNGSAAVSCRWFIPSPAFSRRVRPSRSTTMLPSNEGDLRRLAGRRCCRAALDIRIRRSTISRCSARSRASSWSSRVARRRSLRCSTIWSTPRRASGYLRLVSIPCEIPYSLPTDYRAVAGRGVELRPGKDAIIIGYGPVLLPQAWRAAELLSKRNGLEVAVMNLPWLSHVDGDWLKDNRIRAGSFPARQPSCRWRAGQDGRGRHRGTETRSSDTGLPDRAFGISRLRSK